MYRDFTIFPDLEESPIQFEGEHFQV
jgi:hypothetical protein